MFLFIVINLIGYIENNSKIQFIDKHLMFFLTIWRPIQKSGLVVQFNVLFNYMEANSKIRFSGTI